MSMRSLKSKMVFTITLLTAGILLSTAMLAFTYFKNQFKYLISDEQFSLVAAHTRDIDDKIEDSQAMLVAVSKVLPLDSLRSGDWAQEWLDDRMIIRTHFDNGIFIFSKQGILIAESPFIPGRRGADFSDAEYIRETLSTGKPVISQPHISRKEHHHPIIVMTAPVFDKHGAVAAVLAGSFDLMKENLLSTIGQIKIGKAGYTYLLNRDGTVIVPPDKNRVQKFDVPVGANRQFDTAVAGVEGTEEMMTSQGTRVLMSFKHLRTNNWILAAFYPMDKAYTPISDAKRYFLFVLAVALAIALLTVWLIMSRLTKPLLAFAKHVERLPTKSGAERMFLLNGGDEIRKLALAFNGMIDKLDGQHEALKLSEERYRMFIDTSLDGAYFSDKEGVFQRINQAGATILGHSLPDQVIGKPVNDYWADPAERAVFVAELRKRKSVKSYLLRGRRVDGTEIFLEATSRLLEDDHGNFSGIEGTLRDCTDRIRAERLFEEKNSELRSAYRELTTSKEELRKLFDKVASGKADWENTIDATSEMLVLLDGHGKIIRCNRTLRDLTGMTYDGLLGQSWDQITAVHGLTDKTGHGETAEIFHEASNRWLQSAAYRFRDAANREKTVIAIHDITAVRNMTLALERSNAEIDGNRAKLQRALDELSRLIQEVTQKKDFSVRFSNPNLRHCREVKGCTKKDCPCHDGTDRRCWQVAGTFCGGKVQGVFAEKFKNCSECPTFKHATSDPIYQIGENFNNMMHILDLQHHDLERAYHELQEAQAHLVQQEKMASIGQLAAGVAHEINNPTGFIMSNLGSLRKYVDRLTEFIAEQDRAIGELPEVRIGEIAKQRKALKVDLITDDLRSLISESLDGAERIKKIVQDLKGFSRLDEADQKIADINAGLESTINIVWNELKYKAEVKKHYGDLPQTKCNPGQLNQVFMNLLVNAAHSIENRGEIAIMTWADGGTINVSISDTGCGIPEDNIKRIFEPFFTTKEVGKGTGLGLSIAYDIVKKHNGSIDVQSASGKGTTFTITIPVVAG